LTKLHKLAQNLQEAQDAEAKKEKSTLLAKFSSLEGQLSKYNEDRKKWVSRVTDYRGSICQRDCTGDSRASL
jgi:hypothetical protein